MNPSSMRLVQVLLGKSIAETILVGALAIVFFVTAFPPHFRGWGEVTSQGIAGWAVNSSAPETPVTVQLFVDGQFVANAVANKLRPDVRQEGWAPDDAHGYVFAVPTLSPGPHVARVYAIHQSGNGVRQTLQQLGDPLHFQIDEHGLISKSN